MEQPHGHIYLIGLSYVIFFSKQLRSNSERFQIPPADGVRSPFGRVAAAAVVHNGGDAAGLDAVALRDVARVGDRAKVLHADGEKTLR